MGRTGTRTERRQAALHIYHPPQNLKLFYPHLELDQHGGCLCKMRLEKPQRLRPLCCRCPAGQDDPVLEEGGGEPCFSCWLARGR